MSRNRPSRSWLIVLLLLAFLLGAGSLAVVVGIPAEPAPEAPVADEPEREPEKADPAPPPAPEPTPEPEKVRFVPPPAPKPDPSDAIAKARRRANEVAAIATGRNVSSAQAQFQASAQIDEDNDGTGEFGTFGEMSAGALLRGSDHRIVPSVLSRAFMSVDTMGRVERSGYVYAIYLPGANGRGEAELATGGFNAGVADADLAETTWCMYAWPKEYGKTGTRTFFVNQCGDVLATDCPDYSGDNGPVMDAAFKQDPKTVGTILGHAAVDTLGNDGKRWKQVN